MKTILTFLCSLLLVCPGFAKDKRPNVVVLLADDLGWKDIGCYGGPVKTPALDELAANGVRFTDFYAGAAVCGPSRAVLLTGRHHARAGIYGNVIFDSIQKPHLLQREVTLPEVLKKHGYGTAHFGKWHLGMPTRDVKKPTPAEHGFDYWFGMNSGAHPSHKDPVNFLRNGKPVGKIEGYSCQIVVDEAISWLDDKRDPEAPFFLNLWFHEPHDRVAAPESIVSQYGDLTDQAAVYSATIDNTDRAIARLLDKLKEVDSLENTLVFYTSDNGSYRDDRNGGLRGRKGKSFEGGIRVPGIFYWPGTIRKGHVEHEPAGVVDLLPTVCGLLGIDEPEGVHLDGSDISPLLIGHSNEFARSQPLYWHLPSGNPSLAIRDGDYSMVAYRDYKFPRDRAAIVQVEKEIEEVLKKANSPELVPWVERTDYFYKKFKNRDAERLRGKFMRLNVFQDSWIPVLKSGSYKRFQLFDLAADPSQKVDVSKQHPEVLSRLKRQMLEINASVMAEAPDWGSADEAPTPPSRNRDTSKKPNRPNVVTLLVDDLGYRDLGCYGGPVKTPVLDRLAAGGVRFTDFHSGAPSCSPSRATFLTGRNHRRTGVYSVITERLHKMHLLKSETTIAEVLKENGYATAHFGKWHLGMPVQNRENPTPGDHGFDYWFGLVNGPGPSHKNPTQFLRNGKRVGPMKGYSCQIVVDEALTWLDEKRDAGEPFFLNLWFNEPHAPIAAPDEIVSQYGALNDQAAIYSGTIDNTDRAIGRLVARLEKLGELDNTIIIYSSDNGSYRQERNGELRGKKGALFEGGHRVPGIIYWKGGIPGGRVEDEPAGAVDLLPTLCGLIGIEKPAKVHLDGSDLAPLLTRSGNFKRHQPLFWMSAGPMVMRVGDHTLFASVTAKSPIDFKTADRLTEQIKEVLGDDLEKVLDGMDVKDLRSRLFNHGRLANPKADRLKNQLRDLYYFNEAWIPELKKSGIGRVQLYDLSKDLGQQNDIAKERPELVARMKKQAAAIHRSVMAEAPDWGSADGTPTPPSPSPDTSKTLNSPNAELLARIDKGNVPRAYSPGKHQEYVDRRMAGLSQAQRARIGQLWKEKRRIDPDMSNRGKSFVRIMEYVAGNQGAK
jgi:arylsulfatase A